MTFIALDESHSSTHVELVVPSLQMLRAERERITESYLIYCETCHESFLGSFTLSPPVLLQLFLRKIHPTVVRHFG